MAQQMWVAGSIWY